MATISTSDCLPLARALREGVGGVGLLKALIAFGAPDDTAVARCAKSIADHLIAGKDFRNSFQKASPRLPQAVESLLCRGAENGTLDVVLDEIIGTLEKHANPKRVSEALRSLVNESTPSSPFICDFCFKREFAKLLKRAETETAEEVILEQEGESFFHQRFITHKPVHLIEPSHSKTIRTFRDKLEKAAGRNAGLLIQGDRFRVKRKDDSSFNLFRKTKRVLTISFQ